MNRSRATFLVALSGVFAISTRASDGSAGPDQYICATSTVLAADPLGPGQSGTWSVSVGTAVVADNHSPFTQVSGLSIGENILNWTLITNGVPSFDEVIITVYDPAPFFANAGPDSVLCVPSNSLAMQAAPAVFPAIGSWAVANGTATIQSFANPNSTVTLPTPGSALLIWTVFNGPCGSASDSVVISLQDCIIGVEEPVADQVPMFLFDPHTMSLSLSGADECALEVLDVQGRSVLRQNAGPASTKEFNLSHLPTGCYVVRAASPARSQSARIAITH